MTEPDEYPPTPIDLLRRWDRERPRSLQEGMGWSDIGGCRRQAKYRDEGVPPTDAPDKRQAWLGTLIHDGLAEVTRKYGPPGTQVEQEVWFHGVRGHFDTLTASSPGGPIDTIIDHKTVNQWRYKQVQEEGLDLNQRHQSVGYAAGAMRAGYPIAWIIVDFLCRDTGEHFRIRRPFLLSEVQDAVRWIDNLRATPLEATHRDFRPGSAICDGCDFQSECWDAYARPGRPRETALYVSGDHVADAAWWRDELEEARKMATQGKNRAETARRVLDAIRPNTSGTSPACVVDDDGKALKFTVGEDVRPDLDTIRKDYARTGNDMPETRKEKVTLTIVKRPADAVTHSGESAEPERPA